MQDIKKGPANMAAKKSAIDINLIRELASLLNESDLNEIQVEEGDLRLKLLRKPAAAAPVVASVAAAPVAAAPVAVAAPIASAAAPAEAVVEASSGTPITSPMVGTAYTAPAPGANSAIGGRGGGGYHEPWGQPEEPDRLAEMVGLQDSEAAIFLLDADGFPVCPEAANQEQADDLNQIEAFNGDTRYPARQHAFQRNRASAARPCAICNDPTHWKNECPKAGQQHGGGRRAPGNAHRSRFSAGRWQVNTNGRVTSSDNTGTPFTGGAALAHARGLNAADAAVSTIEWSPHNKIPADPVYHATGLTQPFRRPRR